MMGLQSGFSGHHLLRQWHQQGSIINPSDLVLPIFVTDTDDDAVEQIPSLPNVHRYGVNQLHNLVEPLMLKGLSAVLIFGVLSSHDKKDDNASSATDLKGPACRAIRLLKRDFPDLLVIADVCMCPYSLSGHCGVVDPLTDRVSSSQSVGRLAEIALCYAQSGADVIAPSDMMDGRVHAIKSILKLNGLDIPIMSYSAKFASSFYGPFRDAAKSAPGKGDRSGYQLPPGSIGLALRAVDRDIKEGADMVMVKPAGPYLDVIHAVRDRVNVPVVAYQVSGEYAMIHHAADAGAVDLRQAVMESMTSIKRAGANIIISYFTPIILQWFADCDRRGL